MPGISDIVLCTLSPLYFQWWMQHIFIYCENNKTYQLLSFVFKGFINVNMKKNAGSI